MQNRLSQSENCRTSPQAAFRLLHLCDLCGLCVKIFQLDSLFHLCYTRPPMKSRWEIFHGEPNKSRTGGLRVTLGPKKVFLLNEAVYNALNRPAAVELRFDPETRTIGLAPKDIRHRGRLPHKRQTQQQKIPLPLRTGRPLLQTLPDPCSENCVIY